MKKVLDLVAVLILLPILTISFILALVYYAIRFPGWYLVYRRKYFRKPKNK